VTGEHRGQTDLLESALKSEGYSFTITPVTLPVGTVGGGGEWGDNAGTGAKSHFRLAERVSGILGKEIISPWQSG
jgi:hypothetical protein